MNSQISEGLAETVRQLVLDADSFAYFLIDSGGRLKHQGGELDWIDLPDWQIGENILDKALFLHGYLPLAKSHESILAYQLSDECVIDIHLFDDDGDTLVLMIDRSLDSAEEARSRQQQNEAKLRQRYARSRDE